jgi:molybdate transport system substrate-binding protein
MVQSRISSFVFVFVLSILGFGPALAQGGEPTKLADAKPGDIRLFVSGSMRAPMLAIQGQLERATGRKVVMESSESRTLQREIEAGQPFDAALMTTPVVQDMIKKGKIVAGSDKIVAVVRVGVSVRGDAPKLDVTTPDGLKKAILGAHSIRRYIGVAASVPITDNLFAKLNLEAATKDRIVALDSGNIPPEAPLAPGQYEVIVNLISAIIPMKGWTYLGAIPEQFQMPVFHSAGLGATGDHALGAKVIAMLDSPEFEAALTANGITRK